VTSKSGEGVILDYLLIIQQFVNMKAVVAAVVLTQIIKYYLPAPTLMMLKEGERTTQVEAGKWWTRLLPFAPTLIGMVFCYFLERDTQYTFDDAVKGFMSGALASYLYRTTKVSILGE